MKFFSKLFFDSKTNNIAFLLLLPFIYIYCCHFYTLNPTQQAVITSFGKIIAVDTTAGPGWVSWPWYSINKFEKRFMVLDAKPGIFYTKDKRQALADYFLPYRIVDVKKFFLRAKSIDALKLIIDDDVYQTVNSNFGLNNFLTLVTNREPIAVKISDEVRKKLLNKFGVEVPFVLFNRVNYPPGNRKSVYERMKAEREKISNSYRAEGQRIYKKYKSEADAMVKKILADSSAKAGYIRGEGLKEAARIYNNAYKGPAADFYDFYMSLETAQKAYSKKGEHAFVFNKDDAFFYKIITNDKNKKQ